MTRPVLLAVLTSAILLGSLGLPSATWAQDTNDTGTIAAPVTDQGTPSEQAAATDEITIPDMAQGAEDAPVTVIEYGSFTCPHCANWHAESYRPLKDEFIDTGKVRFIFREVYFDRFGLWASMVARCGGEMRFFGIHDMIYEQQSEWIGSGDPATIVENLRRIGRTAGMDDATLDTCVQNEAQAEALVAWYQQNAEVDAIEGTPTFIINGEKHPNMSYEEMRGVIEAELADSGQ